MNDALRKKKRFMFKIHVELFEVIDPKEYEGMSAGEVASLCEEKYKKYLGE